MVRNNPTRPHDAVLSYDSNLKSVVFQVVSTTDIEDDYLFTGFLPFVGSFIVNDPFNNTDEDRVRQFVNDTQIAEGSRRGYGGTWKSGDKIGTWVNYTQFARVEAIEQDDFSAWDWVIADHLQYGKEGQTPPPGGWQAARFQELWNELPATASANGNRFSGESFDYNDICGGDEGRVTWEYKFRAGVYRPQWRPVRGARSRVGSPPTAGWAAVEHGTRLVAKGLPGWLPSAGASAVLCGRRRGSHRRSSPGHPADRGRHHPRQGTPGRHLRLEAIHSLTPEDAGLVSGRRPCVPEGWARGHPASHPLHPLSHPAGQDSCSGLPHGYPPHQPHRAAAGHSGRSRSASSAPASTASRPMAANTSSASARAGSRWRRRSAACSTAPRRASREAADVAAGAGPAALRGAAEPSADGDPRPHQRSSVFWPNFIDWQRQSRTMESMAALPRVSDSENLLIPLRTPQ